MQLNECIATTFLFIFFVEKEKRSTDYIVIAMGNAESYRLIIFP